MNWSVKNGDPGKGETNTATVLPVKDKVIAGISGGEFGVQGSVTAYSLKDGKRVWRAYSVGTDDEILLDPEKTTNLGKPALARWVAMPLSPRTPTSAASSPSSRCRTEYCCGPAQKTPAYSPEIEGQRLRQTDPRPCPA